MTEIQDQDERNEEEWDELGVLFFYFIVMLQHDWGDRDVMYYRELRNEWGFKKIPAELPEHIVKQGQFQSWSQTQLKIWWKELLDFDYEWNRNKTE